mmetsp:Transcript_22599/g.33047  ORF Transcript_22599/g.33047 Transcript_22599/m.33047 type:complete len:162 (-) Transcript_22599:140-625(-)
MQLNYQAAIITLDILCLGLVLGATVFFFFVQSPKLLLFMGREKFVVIQMRITSWFFLYIQFPLLVCLGCSLYKGDTFSLISSSVALFGGLVNYIFVVPQALKAGKASAGERKGRDSEGTLQKVVIDGAGNSTRFWHQTVVFFVVVMVVGLIMHAYDIAASS